MTSDYPTGTPTGTPSYPTGAPDFDTTGATEEPVELSGGSDESGGLGAAAGTAQERAADLKDSAAESGRHVVETAKDQAGEVADEVKYQAQDLLAQAREELQAQARQQQERVASGLRAVGAQFDDMAAGATEDGMGVHLVRQAADRSRAIGDWLGQREPGAVLDELREFARRRPGVFIAAAATAGILAGRLTRATAQSGDTDAGSEHV